MRALEIPEIREEQIAWLESEIVGTELLVLAAELQAVHGPPASELRLDDKTRSEVRQRGLEVLSPSQFGVLLRDAEQLLKLQRDVLENGGAYWSAIDPPTDIEIPKAIRLEIPSPEPAVAPVRSSRGSTASNFLWATIGSLATAAALLLFANPFVGGTRPDLVQLEPGDSEPTTTVTGNDDTDASTSTWGFAKFARELKSSEQNLEPPFSRESYLRELADAAEAWANRRPDTAVALAKRIGEFRMGCAAILLADHGPLPEADRTWLRERCRRWASALDRHLADVEKGIAVDQVRSDVDSTVTKIAAALQGRADTAAG